MRRKIALGTAGAAAVAPLSVLLMTSAGAATTFAVHGTVAGAYTAESAPPDTGVHDKISGHGRSSLGWTAATGHLTGPGNVASGQCTARVTLTTTHGTVTVGLRSTKSFPSFARCQSGFAFSWRVVTASGDYAGRHGSGTGTLTLVKPGNASSSPPPAYVTFD